MHIDIWKEKIAGLLPCKHCRPTENIPILGKCCLHNDDIKTVLRYLPLLVYVKTIWQMSQKVVSDRDRTLQSR